MRKKIGKALVVGAGISGIRTSIDLAQMGYQVTLTDRAPHLGGVLSQLDYQFPTDRCGMCRMLPMVDRDAGLQTCLRKGLFHRNIDILLNTTLMSVEGEPGKFEVSLKRPPSPVDPDRCIGCGLCADVCPVEVPDAFNAGLSSRKAIYLPVPHNIPNTYTIDPAACTRCGACEPACPTGAIDLSEMGRKGFRILVVDDESIVRDSLDAWLADEEGYTVETAASGPEALEKLTADAFHLMLLDIKMPGMDGVETLEKAKALRPDLTVLMMTAYATVETAVGAMKTGATDYLIKPFEPEDLIPKISTAHEQYEQTRHEHQTVGTLVLATGTDCYDPSTGKNPMGYGGVPNVVTSLEFERMLSGTGPDGGRLLRPSDQRPVKKAAWIQCVGSRDLQCGADFCSTICCMFALKEIAVAKRLVGEAFQATVVYMDLRTFGKSFERYGQATASLDGLRLERGRVHSIAPTPGTEDVFIRWMTTSGKMREEVFDLVVLSIGQRAHTQTAHLAEKLEVQTDSYGFVTPLAFSETRTSREGIFAGGTLTGPTDIAESVIRASSAAINASRTLHRAGGGLMDQSEEASAYRDVSGQPPRILVVLCTCEDDSEDPSETAALTARLQQDPSVARVTTVNRICTSMGREALADTITEEANRLLVVACRTYVYGKRFRDLTAACSLHPSLIEAVAKSERQRWDDPAVWTTITIGMQRLKAAEPSPAEGIPVVNRALVVGGGAAGLSAALAVADHGVPVTLVESADRLGGNLTWLNETIDGTPVAPFLEKTIDRVNRHPGIDVMTESHVVGAFGQAGQFISTVASAEKRPITVEHGAVILATGGEEAPTDAYAYGTSEAVITQREMETRIREKQFDAQDIRSVVMIQCVGSREEPRNYCSRVCCPTSLKQALWLKKQRADLQVYVLYRDMMTCGLTESWYTEARKQGVHFFQYSPEQKPTVQTGDGPSSPVNVRLHDPILNAPVELTADLLILATGIQPRLPSPLALAYGAERDKDGFFKEADTKWRPVEALKAGVFGCGIALSPRSIAESVATGEAAAGRALAILSSERLPAARTTAVVRHSLCTLCLRCVETCPYGARFLDDTGRQVQVNPAMCQGCGDCATVCPNSASIVAGFEHRNLLASIDGAMAG